MNPGTEVELGDKKFVIPPITLGMLRDPGLKTLLKECDEMIAQPEIDVYGLFEKRAVIILAALRRNYPEADLSETDFYDRLDVKNIRDIWPIVIGLSFELPDPASPPGPARPEVPPLATVGT